MKLNISSEFIYTEKVNDSILIFYKYIKIAEVTMDSNGWSLNLANNADCIKCAHKSHLDFKSDSICFYTEINSDKSLLVLLNIKPLAITVPFHRFPTSAEFTSWLHHPFVISNNFSGDTINTKLTFCTIAYKAISAKMKNSYPINLDYRDLYSFLNNNSSNWNKYTTTITKLLCLIYEFDCSLDSANLFNTAVSCLIDELSEAKAYLLACDVLYAHCLKEEINIE